MSCAPSRRRQQFLPFRFRQGGLACRYHRPGQQQWYHWRAGGSWDLQLRWHLAVLAAVHLWRTMEPEEEWKINIMVTVGHLFTTTTWVQWGGSITLVTREWSQYKQATSLQQPLGCYEEAPLFVQENVQISHNQPPAFQVPSLLLSWGRWASWQWPAQESRSSLLHHL